MIRLAARSSKFALKTPTRIPDQYPVGPPRMISAKLADTRHEIACSRHQQEPPVAVPRFSKIDIGCTSRAGGARKNRLRQSRCRMGLISSDVQIKIRWPPIEGEAGLEAKHSGQLCRHGNHVFRSKASYHVNFNNPCTVKFQ
jgi:hypothetical protein